MGRFPETYNDPQHRHCSPLKGKAKSLDVFSSFGFFFVQDLTSSLKVMVFFRFVLFSSFDP